MEAEATAGAAAGAAAGVRWLAKAISRNMRDRRGRQHKQQRAELWILVVHYSGRSGGATWGSRARSGGGGTSKRSEVRRGNGRCNGIFGVGCGGGDAAANTKQLGCYDQEAEEKLAPRGTPRPALHFRPSRDTSGSSGSSGSSDKLANGQRGCGGGSEGGGWSDNDRS